MESTPGSVNRATQPAPLGGPAIAPAQRAKAALRRLAQERLEPTPENYRRAYRAEAGEPPDGGAPLPPAAQRMLERLGGQAGHAVPGLLEAIQQGRWEQADRLLAAAAEGDAAAAQAQAWATLIGRLVKGI